jgi:hypothetical protein
MKKLMVFLYDEPCVRNLNLTEIRQYLLKWLPGVGVEIRPSFVAHCLGSLPETQREDALKVLARRFAAVKVRQLDTPWQEIEPIYGEIEFERRRLSNPEHPVFGLLYDGFRLMHIFRSLLTRRETSLDYLHIIFTSQLIGTYDRGSRRYHVRVVVFGYPCIISTTGLVEAPARPREYYILKQKYEALKMSEAVDIELKEMFQGQYIDHDDARLTEVLKGYVMQTVFYHLTGEPFCEEKTCRLFNAHWQSEVLTAQLGERDFCPRHEEMLKSFAKR